MNLRAEANDAFLLKYLIIGLVCTGFGFWSIYDAFVGYPNMIPRSAAWEELLKDTTLKDEERKTKYKELATEKGWPIKYPSKDESVEKIKSDIIWQYIFMAIGFGVGLPLVAWYLKCKGSWIELDGQTIRSSSGQQVSFNEIVNFDKKKWDKKGIGVVNFERNGKPKRFVIDDLKYDRKTTDKIVQIMESNLLPNQIINGQPEVVPAKELLDTAE